MLCRSDAERDLPGVFRQFVYLPFEHSEDIADQLESLRLFARLGQDEPALAGPAHRAEAHHDIVARFGRFRTATRCLGANRRRRGRVPEAAGIRLLSNPVSTRLHADAATALAARRPGWGGW